ncbi:MAG: hypothetical protein ACYDHW_07700 [Syntrophorhabdaceae bacterium]
MNDRRKIDKTEKNDLLNDPRILMFILYYSQNYMGMLGPFVSSVFFAVLLNSGSSPKRGGAHIKSAGLSISEIADIAGISKRKAIDALKVLKKYWIIVQRNGRGRGNKNRYYFVPVESWYRPENSVNRLYPAPSKKVNGE